VLREFNGKKEFEFCSEIGDPMPIVPDALAVVAICTVVII